MARQLSIGLFVCLAVTASSVAVQGGTDATSVEDPVRRVPKEGLTHESAPVRRVQEVEVVVGGAGLVTQGIQNHAQKGLERTAYGCACIGSGNTTNYCYTHGEAFDWCYVDRTECGHMWSWDYCVKRHDTTHGNHCKNDGSAESTCGNWCESTLGSWALGNYSWCKTAEAWDYCTLPTAACANIAGTYADGSADGKHFTVSQTDCKISFTYTDGASMVGTVSVDTLQVCGDGWGTGSATRVAGTAVTHVNFANRANWVQQAD